MGRRKGSVYRCSICREPGHTRRKCPYPDRGVTPEDPTQTQLRASDRAFQLEGRRFVMKSHDPETRDILGGAVSSITIENPWSTRYVSGPDLVDLVPGGVYQLREGVTVDSEIRSPAGSRPRYLRYQIYRVR